MFTLVTTKSKVFGFILACFMLATNGNEKETNDAFVTKEIMKQDFINPKLNMTLCSDKCGNDDCMIYITPIDKCFSSTWLFPNDPSWSGKDIRDRIAERTRTLVRTIFDTENGTCRGSANDVFHIPLNECVGPFGKPRPWGIFRTIGGQRENLIRWNDDSDETQ